MRVSYLVAAIVLATGVCRAEDLNRDQTLIIACFKLDIDGVVRALRDGANVNSQFGNAQGQFFDNPWDLGWSPIGSNQWTPLLAVANASDYPDPPRKIQNTIEDLQWSREQKAKIPRNQVDEHQRAGVAIAQILLSHRAAIDANDGHGATALYNAISNGKPDLAKLLLRFNANVNTKTRVYIDGPGDITPLHEAAWSFELTKMLLEKGADPNAKDTDGETPADWARRSHDPAVLRLYRKQ